MMKVVFVRMIVTASERGVRARADVSARELVGTFFVPIFSVVRQVPWQTCQAMRQK
jgi:hypothetical protein